MERVKLPWEWTNGGSLTSIIWVQWRIIHYRWCILELLPDGEEYRYSDRVFDRLDFLYFISMLLFECTQNIQALYDGQTGYQ